MENVNIEAAKKRNPHVIRRLYDWVLHWADTPHGVIALVILSFAESSFFPVPPDILLMALALGAVKKSFRFALYCSIASVLGGMFGYLIGMVAWESVGVWIVEHLAHGEVVEVAGRSDIPLPEYLHRFGGEYLFQVYDQWNAWIVFVFGLTPLPYKLVTITAGVARVNFPVFVLASVASRSLRFFLVAAVIRVLGRRAKEFIDKYFNLLTILFMVLLIGGFLVIRIVFDSGKSAPDEAVAPNPPEVEAPILE